MQNKRNTGFMNQCLQITSFFGHAGRKVSSVALSAGGYAVASVRLDRSEDGSRLARSTVGHAAGVVNYVLAGLVSGALALPGPWWTTVLLVGSLATVAINLAAVVARLLPREREPPRP